MASICPPQSFPSTQTSNFTTHRFRLSRRLSQSGIRVSDSGCRCRSSSGDESSNRRWDFDIQETIRSAVKRFDDLLSSFMDWRDGKDLAVVAAEESGGDEEEEWDWERWRKHFADVDEQERAVSILKSQLVGATEREDYDAAARLKVAIAAAATNDTVGRVMSHLRKYVEEEHYGDAAHIRDCAGTGLVGWWAGLSEDANDPYGRIIRISAEYGKYVARSFSPRQLATASIGSPVFEVYLRSSKNGEYKQQAVYLKRKGAPPDISVPSIRSSGSTRDLDSREVRDKKSKLFERSSENNDSEDRDDDSNFDKILRDMIPGVKVKVVKVTAPEKVDQDIISKVIEQIIDEEEEEKDYDLENEDSEDETESENDDDDDEEHNNLEVDADVEQNQVAVEVVISDGFIPKLSHGAYPKDLLRVPARLEQNDRLSFTFTVEEDANEHISSGDGLSSQRKRAKLLGHRSMDLVMLDLVKSVGKGKIPMKVLKDVGELINLTLGQAGSRQPLSGSTNFNRIDIGSSSDPLNGLYIGAHGLYTSEVIQMKRRYGQWKDDGNSKTSSKIEFYEYVEAVKLTGDPYVPAGQVAFRAKVGKRYQLPHKGILPEELGVVARYKGQGRLAEPGFQNPRWVDGELVILDGKYIRGGPVVGFVYWAPEYHFLVFFNRLRLQE